MNNLSLVHSLRRRNDGFVLVTVLMIIAVLLPIAIGFVAKVRVDLLQVENLRNGVDALRMARSGVEVAMGLLIKDDPSYDSIRDTWSRDFPRVDVNSGTLLVKVEDEDAKIPVNLLVGPHGVNMDVDSALRALVSRLGVSPDIVDALIDWEDEDNTETGAFGAEDDYYRTRGYRCKNGPLDSVEELLSVKGLDRELVVDKGLAGFITVAPTDGRINLNTAPVQVLQAVLGSPSPILVVPLNESDITDFLTYREVHDLLTISDFERAVKISTTQSAAVNPLVKVNSTFFTVRSTSRIGSVSKTVEALIKRDGSVVWVMFWREF